MSVRVIMWEEGTHPIGPAVVAIGVFDGVHLGHQALIASACEDARARGVSAAALTFDRDPDQVVTPDSAAPQLLSIEDKCRFLAQAGADTVLVIPFDVAVAALPPERFVEGILAGACTPLAVHVGEDFRFGRFAEGDVRTLLSLGQAHGFDVRPHSLVTAGGAPVTSTRIRALVAAGAVADAATLLGRSHRVAGMVTRGRGEGVALLGIPTANVVPAAFSALPADGVYAGGAEVGDTGYPAAISVGVPPSFPGAHHVLEAHLLGFHGDLVHREITLTFSERLRDQRRFSSTDDLARAMRDDIARAGARASG